MKAKKITLITLILTFLACVLSAVVLYTSSLKTTEALTYGLRHVNGSLEQNYLAHWKAGQGQYGYGESSGNGGQWYFCSGEISNTSGTNDVYSATDGTFNSSTSSITFSDGLAYKEGYDLTASTTKHSMLVWIARGSGKVSFNGMFSKATSEKNYLASTQNGLDNESVWIPGINWGAGQFKWTEGESYTVSVHIARPNGQGTGKYSVGTIISNTYTSEYVFLMPENEIYVNTNDRVIFALKANTVVGSYTNTVAIMDANFTPLSNEQMGTYTQLYTPASGTSYSSYNYYFNRSVVDNTGPFYWASQNTYQAGHTAAVYIKYPVTTAVSNVSGYAMWIDIPASTENYTFSIYYNDNGSWGWMPAGNRIHMFGDDGSYSYYISNGPYISLGTNNPFRGWMVFSTANFKTVSPDQNDDLIIQVNKSTSYYRDTPITVKVGSIGCFTDKAKFLYKWANTDAVDTYYQNEINDYSEQISSLSPETTTKTLLKNSMSTWIKDISDNYSGYDLATKITTASTLNETYATKYVQYLACNASSSKKVASLPIVSDIHTTVDRTTGAAKTPTMANEALKDITQLNEKYGLDSIALLNLGDLTDYGNNTQNTTLNEIDDYYTYITNHYLTTSSGASVPWLSILGNHDVRGPSYDAGDAALNVANYNSAVADYKALDPILKSANSISSNGLNFSYNAGGFTFIMLNTCEYQRDDCMLSADDLNWLDAELTRCGGDRPVFILIHQPSYSNKVEDVTDMNHKSTATMVSEVASKIDNGVKGSGFKNVIAKHPNSIVMSGHDHDPFGENIIVGEGNGHYINQPSMVSNYYATHYDEIEESVSQYYYAIVYEEGIVFMARDFGTDSWVVESFYAVEFEKVDSNLKAWYKFDNLESAGADSVGSYDLTTINPIAPESGDGIVFPTYEIPEISGIAYSKTSANNPFLAVPTGSAFTVSGLFYLRNANSLGSLSGGANILLQNSPGWDGTRITIDWGSLVINWNGTQHKVAIPEQHQWYRITLKYDGTNATTIVHNVSTDTEILNESTALSNYSLGTSNGVFCIGTRASSDSIHDDQNFRIPNCRIADLRIYSNAISDFEYKKIMFDTASESTVTTDNSVKMLARYLGDSGVAGKDLLGENDLAKKNTVSYSSVYWGAQFSHTNSCLYAPDLGDGNDLSDMLVKQNFSVVLRARIKRANSGNVNKAYYLINTGSWSTGFGISVNWRSIYVSLGNGSSLSGTSASALLENICTNDDNYQYVRVYVTYDGETLSVSAYNETTKEWYADSVEYVGGSFGGYPNSLTLGGQSRFGESLDAMAMASGEYTSGTNTATFSRAHVTINDLIIYKGVISQEKIDEIDAQYSAFQSITGDHNSHTLIAQYEFGDLTNLGKDSSGNYDLVNAGGVSYNQTLKGITLNAGGDATSILYATKGIGHMQNNDFSDKYYSSVTISMRLYAKTTSGGTYKIMATGSGQDANGMYIALKNDGLEVSVYGVAYTFTGIFNDKANWYRITVILDRWGENDLTVTAVKEVESEYSYTQSQALTSTSSGNGFGGSLTHSFTLGGQSAYGESFVDGAYDSTLNFAPTLSEFRVYSGVINQTEVDSINGYDANNMYIVGEQSSINMSISNDLSMNYYIVLSGGTAPVFNIVYNGHEFSKVAVLENGRWTVSVNEMAPQDMNDKIVIESIEFEWQGKTYNLDITGWSRASVSAQDYLYELIDTYSLENTVENQKVVNIAKALLNYGSAAQTYLNHDTEYLANANLTEQDKTLYISEYNEEVAQSYAVRTLTGTVANSLQFTKASLYFDNQVGFAIQFKVQTSNANNVALNIKATGVSTTITASEMTSWVDGEYTYFVAIYQGLKPTEYSKVFNFTVSINGVEIGQTLNYNVYANIYMLANKENSSANLVKALYHYAEMANQYSAN
ncbi:MAG: metallophosphoesterase [Clostridia bacterium]|nr:metallophosphoesterase [Clostridia bacterium]